MSRSVYWDRVLVVDDEIPEEILTNAHNTLIEKGALKDGVVSGDLLPEETIYQTYHDKDLDVKFLVDHLHSMDVIPVLEGHTAYTTVKRHRMESGGKMAWHTDAEHSVALSLYLTDPMGGELQVIDKKTGSQSVVIAPKRNRFVVMKCDSEHRVLEVLDGERESIQIFVDYIKDKKDA